MIVDSVAKRRELLENSKTVAMIGASANPLRPSYTVFSYLRTMTPFEVTPINPTLSEIDGVKAYPSLTAYAQQHGAPDVVDVFRKPSEVVEVVREAIAVGAKCIWFQYGIINEDAIRMADEAGLAVVVDRCIKVEWARLSGGLSTSGLNSGLITSRRRIRSS
ncbi:MAG TPA: CoA-binding protein [Candidatus Baltobacteraceae bacterium]|nr:CoA-binding protein [Candidatus Baltobacteraceae bacterium]